jgi:hypothetical protein
MRKLLSTVAALALLASPALASSGSYVVNVKSAGQLYPHCVQFWMFDDEANNVVYGFSDQDAGAAQSIMSINTSRMSPLMFSGVGMPITFSVTTPSNPALHPADCPSTTLYVTGITY